MKKSTAQDLDNVEIALHWLLEYLKHPKKEDWKLMKAKLYIEKVLKDKNEEQ